MRVLHVITSLRVGGAEKLMVELLPAFNEKGIGADILLFNGEDTFLKKRLTAKNVKIIQLTKDSTFYYNPFYIIKLVKIIRNYDIIHTHNTAPQLFCALVNVFCRKLLITTEHSTYNRRRNNKLFCLLDKWMYNKYENIICISIGVESKLREYLSRTDLKIKTINNGINLKKYEVYSIDDGIDDLNKVNLIMVSRFSLQKDQKTIIRAMSLLPENINLMLVGIGECEDECKLLVKELNLEKRVSFMGLRSDIAELLYKSDIVIQSSHWEGFGLAVVEGMASGKPVVASDVEGLSEIVNGYGLLFEKGNEYDLSKQIMSLVSSSELYNEVSKKCKQRAKYFSIENMINGYIHTYKELYNKQK